jgi:hypothetical protein
MSAEFSALLHPLNLRPTDASMLVLIGANPGITQSALGQAMGVQRANMAPARRADGRMWLSRAHRGKWLVIRDEAHGVGRSRLQQSQRRHRIASHHISNKFSRVSPKRIATIWFLR